MLWAYELNVQLIGALTGAKASMLIALLPAVALLTVPIHIVAAMEIGRERMRPSRPFTVSAEVRPPLPALERATHELQLPVADMHKRSEERRVGKECVSK